MKRLIFALLWLLGTSPLPALAQGVPNSAQVVSSCGSTPSTYTAGLNYPLLQDTSGRQCINTGGSSTNTNVNVQQVGGASVSTAASGTQKVGVVGNAGTALDSAAGTPNAQAVTIQGNASAVAVPVTVTPSVTVGLTPVTSAALAANLVVKASPGNLYSFEVAADSTLSGAAWWVMVYNATTAPADGSVTPAKCYALPLGATSLSAAFPTPINLSAGIVIGVGTTGCFTKTASTHALISGDAD